MGNACFGKKKNQNDLGNIKDNEKSNTTAKAGIVSVILLYIQETV
jgi:hypothetical protein